MKSIILTYPGYQTLPRGIKQMLVASESDFFSEAIPARLNHGLGKRPYWRPVESRMAGVLGGCREALNGARVN